MRIIFILIIIVFRAEGAQEMDNYPQYEMYSDYDYIKQKNEQKLQCFSCIYTFEAGVIQGSRGCIDPFNYDPHTVNLEACNNGSCAKINLVIENKYSMVHRGCLFNCTNKQSTLGSTECCGTDFCNGYQTSRISRTLAFVNIIVSFRCIFGLYCM